MHIEDLRDYCLAKTAAQETMPFGPDVLVMKVAGKMFAAMNLSAEETSVNLKCDPERAQMLRDQHADIIPGWHMNKKHWNTIYTERGLDAALIHELIDHSYDLVVASLPKKTRELLEGATD